MNNRTESQLEKNMEEITFNNIIEYISNKISDLEEDSSISFNLRIELDDNTLTNAHNNTKLLVKLIVDEIEEGDGYKWTWYRELERDYKESNRKRMDRFDCHGKLIIGVDIAAKEAKVKLSHNIQHEKPLRTHICQRFDNALQVTPKQINYWWSTFNQRFFKLDETPFISAPIGFITPLLTELLPVSNIHCDATYKTTRGWFELYGIISSTHGARFPIAYLMLNTTDASDNAQMGLRTKSLTGFLRSLCNKGLQPLNFFTDKDFAQINATKEVWPNINVQLCLWHIEKAIKEKIRSYKKIKQTQYRPSEERDWSRLAATPIDNNDHTRYFIDSAQVNTQKSIISIASHESGNNLIEMDKEDEALGPGSGNTLAKMDENEEVSDLEMTQICRQKVEAVRRMADHLEHELAANNFNHVICVTDKIDRLFTMLNDIETVQNRRRRNPTWRGSTPWTLYLQ
ncbi:19648_t:CDS:2, partial [Gigaspora rosea]